MKTSSPFFFLREFFCAFLLCFMFFCVFLSLPSAAADESHVNIHHVQKAIVFLLKEAPARKLYTNPDMQFRLSSDIISASSEWDVPPLLLTTVTFFESSFRPGVTGKLGERGLTQVHGVASRNCDLSTQKGQLLCGAKWLSAMYGKCLSWNGALSAYSCGSCTARTKGARITIDRRIRLWNKLRKIVKE